MNHLNRCLSVWCFFHFNFYDSYPINSVGVLSKMVFHGKLHIIVVVLFGREKVHNDQFHVTEKIGWVILLDFPLFGSKWTWMLNEDLCIDILYCTSLWLFKCFLYICNVDTVYVFFLNFIFKYISTSQYWSTSRHEIVLYFCVNKFSHFYFILGISLKL